MNLEISVKNYRCFGEKSHARLELRHGITALIGSNNSGKSTLLRLFYEFQPLFEKLSHDVDSTAALFAKGLPLPPLRAVQDPWKIFNLNSQADLVIGIRILRAPGFDETAVSGPDALFLAISHKNFHCHARTDHSQVAPTDNLIFLDKWRKVFNSLTRSLYIGPFRGLDELLLYTPESPPDYRQQLKQQIFSLLENDHGIQRVYEEIKVLFHFRDFEIRIAKGHTPQLEFYVNGALTPIEELGSGLGQTLIILLRAQIHRPDYIFIDEPEAHLHASIQNDFITALSGFAKVGMVFASHNVGLAKIAGDRAYSIRRDPRSNNAVISPFKPEIRLSEMVGEANFAAQQIEGCSKVLLVEGPTEIRAIRQILRKMNADHGIVLIPLGGGSMITANRDDELREITRICRDVYCLIDSEKTTADAPIAADRLAFKASCEKVGIECHILERRAFENYLSEKAIRSYYGSGFRALGPFDDLKSKNPNWHKVYNWKIARAMPLSDFEATDLGQFLKKVVSAPCAVGSHSS